MKKVSGETVSTFIRFRGREEKELRKWASPYVRSEACINCGVCLGECPTGAIAEHQRQVCRLCPDCAQGPVMFPRDMEALTARSCSLSCPLGHFPEGYINMVARGDWEGAWRLISDVNPLPATLGRICQRPCEEECKRGMLVDEPLPIREIKRLVSDWAWEAGLAAAKRYTRHLDMRVAVAGAGPAGVTAASELAAMGYRVTLLEAAGHPGGMLREALPRFRLPDRVWEREIGLLLENGIDLVCGVRVGKNPTLEDLFKEGFRAVVLAVGGGKGKKPPLPGSDYAGVYDGISFMSAVKAGLPVETGERAVVVGGGSVATDAARTMIRLGWREVTMVCPESEDETPALSWEMEEALREGVKVLHRRCPSRILSSWMRVEGVELLAVTDCTADERGRVKITTSARDRSTLPADTVVLAVGQDGAPDLFRDMGLELGDDGCPKADPVTGATSRSGVFAAGDVLGGRGSVVRAVAEGKRAARGVDAFLQGKILQATERRIKAAPLDEKIFPVRLEKARPLDLSTDGEAAVGGVGAPSRELLRRAETEARRCMRCGYVDVDHDLCLGCGICSRRCPVGDVITMGAPLPGGGEG
jgi:NADPH-dependent glutamate synthase beta subunit-like oxidoreductase/NAD-dependent dihydropyrimidine dehydrogenase PreA subunit